MLRHILSRKRDIIDRFMARLLQSGDHAIDALIDVVTMNNYDSNMKSNASDRIKAAEAVLDRIGLVRLTEADVEKKNGMSLYEQINQHFYGGGSDDSDED